MSMKISTLNKKKRNGKKKVTVEFQPQNERMEAVYMKEIDIYAPKSTFQHPNMLRILTLSENKPLSLDIIKRNLSVLCTWTAACVPALAA